jgi:redox-sensitive bicupin YhaK (pirin superfamily)
LNIMSRDRNVKLIDVPSGLALPSLKTFDLTFQNQNGGTDPFLVISLFDMTGPTFPPHPHAGFSVATYIFPESDIGFWNQDSLGMRNTVLPGSLHWTVAGSGLLHEETVMRSGHHARGFQVWINHRLDDRHVKPEGRYLASSDVPIVESDGSTTRVLVGILNAVPSPLHVPVAVRILDIEISEEGCFSDRLGKGERGYVWVRSGRLNVNGSVIKAGQVGSVGGGYLMARSDARVGTSLATLFVGIPNAEVVLQGGPFVASSPRELAEFQARFRSGGMGHLRAFDQVVLDAEFDAR